MAINLNRQLKKSIARMEFFVFIWEEKYGKNKNRLQYF